MVKLHIHVWDLAENEEEPVEEQDLELTDAYIDPQDNDDERFFQFSTTLTSIQEKETDSIEIRLSIRSLKELMKMAGL